MAKFTKSAAPGKAKAKVPVKVTGRQAQLAANLMSAKKGKLAVPAKVAPVKAVPMDAEDLIDGGVDEATEKN